MKSISIKNYNFRLVVYVLLLNVIGVMVIRSASGGQPAMVEREIIGACAGVAAMCLLSAFSYRKLQNLSIPVYLVCIGLLVMVLIMGRARGVARRWVTLPAIGQIQPSEFVKVGMVLVFSKLVGDKANKIDKFGNVFLVAAAAAVPLALIFLEPDLSTTIVLAISIISMLFASGISYRWVFGALAVAVPSVAALLIALKNNIIPFISEYQARRILAWFDKASYADANIQQDNSIMAIASGQLLGKGLNNNTLASVKNGNFLSEQETDFIFAVVGEELGFIGCLIVVLLFALVVFECLRMASKAADMQGRLICTGMAILIGFQSFTNIAVATGIFPNTGLPLPFVSYGVSSLLSMYMGIGLVLNVGLLSDSPADRRFL